MAYPDIHMSGSTNSNIQCVTASALHTDIHWISKGKVLSRFWDPIEEVKIVRMKNSMNELLN